jgi:hypothetical protein
MARDEARGKWLISLLLWWFLGAYAWKLQPATICFVPCTTYTNYLNTRALQWVNKNAL